MGTTLGQKLGFTKDEVQQAFSFFSDKGQEVGMGKALDDALHKGEGRTAQEQHVFVHPEFAWNKNGLLRQHNEWIADQSIRDYHDRIHELMSKHPAATIISYKDARHDFDGLPYDDSEAIPTADLGVRSVSGLLDAQGMKRFLEVSRGIREDDKVVIHGAAWEACPKAFACQLLFAAHLGVFIPPTAFNTVERGEVERYQRILMTVLYHSHYIAKNVRMRLGILHNTQNISRSDGLTADLSEDGLTQVFGLDS